MCKSLDLRILNGRCKGDSLGQITFHDGNQGSSTVDYIIVSHEILYLFETLVVPPPSPFSDHCQLITRIKIDSTLLTNNEEIDNELLSLPRQFKWSTDSKDSFNSALNSDEIKQLIRHYFELRLLNFEHVRDINITVEKFAHLLETAAKQSLKIVKQN